MAGADAVLPPGPIMRCDHCGRTVAETQHTRTDYRVDYYSLHTGMGELCSVAQLDGQKELAYVKLLSTVDVVTCVDCYRHAGVQRQRELRFRPEQSAEEEQAGG